MVLSFGTAKTMTILLSESALFLGRSVPPHLFLSTDVARDGVAIARGAEGSE